MAVNSRGREDDAKTPVRERRLRNIPVRPHVLPLSTLLSVSTFPPWPPGMHSLAIDTVQLPPLQIPGTRSEQIMPAM